MVHIYEQSRKVRSIVVASGVLALFAVLAVVIHQALREPVMEAAVRGDVAAVDRLTKLNPFLLNTTWPDSLSSDTLLSVAITNRQQKVALLLIGKGANVNAGGQAGTTPLHYAAEWGNTDVIGALLSAGAKVNTTNSVMETPAFAALFHGHEDAYRLLVRRGASPAPPLHVAASFGDLAGVRSALTHDPGGINSVLAHRTPLQHAAAHGHLAVVRYLLEQGAETDESTVTLAKESGNPDVVAMIRSHTALRK